MSNNANTPVKKTVKKPAANNGAPNSGAKKQHRNERAHQLKIYAIGSVLILLAIVLLANILLDKVFGKSLTFDFSAGRSNVISDTSVKFLESLPQDTRIRIVGLFERPESVYDTEYQYIVPILDDYVKKSNGKVSIEYVDMQKNPGIIQSLDPSGSFDLSNKTGSYVVSYNGKIDIIDPISCYTIDTDLLNQYNKYVATGINTEYTFTNSMISLVKGFSNKAYFVTGLKENASTQLKRILNAMGTETADIDSTAGFKVPADCNLLILNGPNTDIPESMFVEIKEYIEKGGKVIAAVDYSSDNVGESYKNLNRLLNEMNINVEHCMVSENDPAYQLNTKINDSQADVAQQFSNYSSEKKMHITLARPLSASAVKNSNYTTYPVLTTSAKATKSIADENNQAKEIVTDQGIINVAMYSSYNVDNPGEIYVFGTVNFTSDVYYEQFTINDRNADFIRGCVRSMLKMSDENNVDIPVKKIDGNRLSQSKATTTVSTGVMIVFMIILPLILSSMAVVVYNKRKNL